MDCVNGPRLSGLHLRGLAMLVRAACHRDNVHVGERIGEIVKDRNGIDYDANSYHALTHKLWLF